LELEVGTPHAFLRVTRRGRASRIVAIGKQRMTTMAHPERRLHPPRRAPDREEEVESSGVEKEHVMNREEVNWLLQTIKDAKNAERFVSAQYERGRISYQVMADVAREQGWINRLANRFSIPQSIEYATTALPIAVAC
jgi:hypothetical protein